MELKDYIATIENYPKEGVVFRDISPLMADGNAYNYAATEIVQPGKLPREVIEATYEKEYGTDTLTMHADSIKPGQRVLIVDDLLATGGTIAATIELVEKMGGIVVGCAFLIELDELKGRERIGNYDYKVLMHY